MIIKNFRPKYIANNFRWDYLKDNDIWQGNKPLRIDKRCGGIGVFDKSGKLKDLIRYDFNFGQCVLFEDDDGKIKILKCSVFINDGWRIFISIPLGLVKLREYGIWLDRLTSSMCVVYDLSKNKIKKCNATKFSTTPYENPTIDDLQVIKNIINMKVDNCYIWNIIQSILLENFKGEML